MSSPEISVLMPTYNYASYLPEAVESVLAQDFRDFELLIVDDCSTDRTAEAVQPFCARDRRIHFSVNPANLGMVANWNECLKRARSRHIKYLFGDDKLSDPSALGKMLALLQSNPRATLAASARKILDADSRVIQISRTLRQGLHDGKKMIRSGLLEQGNLIGEPSAVMFRKPDAARGFDPAYRQLVDLEMWFHLLEKGDLIYTSEPLCAFRRHARQQTAVNNATFSIKEQLMLITTYGAKPWLTRGERVDILYRALRALRRDPASKPQFRKLERTLVPDANYSTAKVKYALRRPLENLKRSLSTFN